MRDKLLNGKYTSSFYFMKPMEHAQDVLDHCEGFPTRALEEGGALRRTIRGSVVFKDSNKGGVGHLEVRAFPSRASVSERYEPSANPGEANSFKSRTRVSFHFIDGAATGREWPEVPSGVDVSAGRGGPESLLPGHIAPNVPFPGFIYRSFPARRVERGIGCEGERRAL